MVEESYDKYILKFCNALKQNLSVQGIAALGSTSESSLRDNLSDHDFVIVVGDYDPETLLSTPEWMPDPGRIIAHERHALVHAVAIYEGGHKVEYAVYDEITAEEMTVTRFSVLLDRGRVGDMLDRAREKTIERRSLAALDANPVNLAILLTTAAARAARGEVLSAADWISKAVDMLLVILADHLNRSGSPLSDMVDPRRRLEFSHPATAANLSKILRLEPGLAVVSLVELANSSIRPETGYCDWHGFDRVVAAVENNKFGLGVSHG